MEIKLKKIVYEIRKEIGKIEQNLVDEQFVLKMIEEKLAKDFSIQEIGHICAANLVKNIYYTVRKDMGILFPYVEDNRITEIMVNGKGSIFIEKEGKIQKQDEMFLNDEELEEVIRRIAAKVHREINELNPILDARLEDGSRINAVYKNIALNGPILTIRKFPEKAFSMGDLISFKTVTEEAANYLKTLVQAGYNIFVCGGTSSGKTSMLNVLSNYIPEHERVIVIEDSAELQINSIPNVVRLECRNANVQGQGKVDMQQLIKSSLRMRPDRIIVGEVRGKEVLDMLNAMNTGHDGSLSTGHGNSVKGMLSRLETMVLQAVDFPIDAIRNQIAEGIDIMVHLSRMPDRSRKVLEISEICGYEENGYILNRLFKYDVKNGLVKTSSKIINTEKLEMSGLRLEEIS